MANLSYVAQETENKEFLWPGTRINQDDDGGRERVASEASTKSK